MGLLSTDDERLKDVQERRGSKEGEYLKNIYSDSKNPFIHPSVVYYLVPFIPMVQL